MTFLEKGCPCSTVAKLSDILRVCSALPCWGFYADSQVTQMQLPKTPAFVTRGCSLCYQFVAI